MRLPFPPRPLLPFGRISLRETARRSSAPPFGFAAQNRARHFAAHSLGGRPLRGHGFATPHRYFAVPVTAAPRRGPNGKTPALVAVRLHFATRNRSVGRCLRRGGNRKPRVRKEEGPRCRGDDYESPTAYFLSIKMCIRDRSRSVPGSHPHAGGNPTENECGGIHRISQREKQFDDFSTTRESEVQIWESIILVQRVLRLSLIHI